MDNLPPPNPTELNSKSGFALGMHWCVCYPKSLKPKRIVYGIDMITPFSTRFNDKSVVTSVMSIRGHTRVESIRIFASVVPFKLAKQST